MIMEISTCCRHVPSFQHSHVLPWHLKHAIRSAHLLSRPESSEVEGRLSTPYPVAVNRATTSCSSTDGRGATCECVGVVDNRWICLSARPVCVPVEAPGPLPPCRSASLTSNARQAVARQAKVAPWTSGTRRLQNFVSPLPLPVLASQP